MKRSNLSKPSRKCPQCGCPVSDDAEAFPFCCERCRTIDLAKWRDEKYVISRPIEQADLDEGE